MREARDYAVEAEPAVEHLRNALQIINAMQAALEAARDDRARPIDAIAFALATDQIQRVQIRLTQAIALLERPHG
jgi:hypothetical protein